MIQVSLQGEKRYDASMLLPENFQGTVAVTRARATKLYSEVAKDHSTSTVLLDLLQTLLQRIGDIEDVLGARTPASSEVAYMKMDTQGR